MQQSKSFLIKDLLSDVLLDRDGKQFNIYYSINT